MQYTNPIIPGFHPDPSICRVGNDFFLVNSSFEYFPGVPLFHSRDLVHWQQIGYCLTRESQLNLRHAWICNGIFAPTIRYHNGLFYMITTNVSDGGNFFVTTADPYGSWSEPIWFSHRGIDPSLYFDEDGTAYMTGSHNDADGTQGILQCIIDPTNGQLLSDYRLIWSGTGGKGPEGPHLFKKGAFYYLLIAEGGTEYGHMVTVARSSSPWGPFEACPHNPIVSHRSLEHPIQATGHADLVEDQHGQWWMVCLGIRPNGYPPCHHLGRETLLAQVSWTSDGWPVVGNEGKIDLKMEINALPALHTQRVEPESSIRDDFDTDKLPLYWNFLRNPDPQRYSLTNRPGWIRLSGSHLKLNDGGSPTFLGRRQQHFDCQITTLIDFEPQQDYEEAGLVVYMNNWHHYELAITRLDGVRSIIVRRTIGSLSAIVARKPVSADPLEIGIQATRNIYKFTFQEKNAVSETLATGETRYLSTEVAGGFTGVFLGMYATGNGQETITPAYFDWFEYQPQEN